MISPEKVVGNGQASIVDKAQYYQVEQSKRQATGKVNACTGTVIVSAKSTMMLVIKDVRAMIVDMNDGIRVAFGARAQIHLCIG